MRRTIQTLVLAPVIIASLLQSLASAQAGAEKPSLVTKWAAEVSAEKVWPEYPRPQLVRKRWLNLNGNWDYAIVDGKGDERPRDFDGKILVPFPVESILSSVSKPVRPDQSLWYRRTFQVPAGWRSGKLLLHFGAVDWEADIWVDDRHLGQHRGGYDKFSFDITEALSDGDDHTLVVRVIDPTNRGPQPRGKQVLEPRGIWYTAVTGIWQTVWIEPVPSSYIASLKLTPHCDSSELEVLATTVGDGGGSVDIQIARSDGEDIAATGPAGKPFRVSVPKYTFWSPEKPHLYNLVARLGDGDAADRVESYFGMRKIKVAKDNGGHNRLFLNNESLFLIGPLDQGWWPDGLYTAPTDEALRYDIEVMKQLGYNMCRKHVKVEPARWYYWCDRLGLLVWQDMPSGDRYIGGNDPDYERSPESEAIYRRELQALIDHLYNHPSVIVWVPFNEGWGQFKTNEIIRWIQQYDHTRLVDGPSGWSDRGEGDMHDMHSYPGPDMFPAEEKRASVLGEFGGLGLPLSGHLWQEQGNWGYRTFSDRAGLAQRYHELIDDLWLLVGRGLAAAVYTQLTDVEGEVNGLMTYDRRVIKFDPQQLAEWHRQLHGPPPAVREIVPTADTSAATWKYTTSQPTGEWWSQDYDDSAWQEGQAGFGTAETPGTHVRTEWNTPDIWLRRTIDLPPAGIDHLHLKIHHDESAEVYANGHKIAAIDGYTTGYRILRLAREDQKHFRPGRNVLAVNCHQTSGGQYIDLGLVAIEPQRVEGK